MNETDTTCSPMDIGQRIIKRLMDIVGASLGLLLASPLFLVAYILLKLQNDGPVIFAQERIGYKGKPFHIYKFRTMAVNAETDQPRLAQEGDDRLTPAGHFLREHHLDELPQLWNVLAGDMSFVGHRPERQFFIDQIMQEDARYAELYAVRPGVTSNATLYNGYTDTMKKMLTRLEMDLHYVRHQSLWLDLKIVWNTFTAVFGGKKF